MKKMQSKIKKPPKIAEWFLYHTLDKNDRDFVTGDFAEIFSEIRTESGVLKASVWYWWQIIKSIPHFISNYLYWRVAMLRNYLKIAIRNIKKNKGYSFINITGLAVGMACCILIFLWVQDELSYDRFHQNKDNLYRIVLGDPRLGPDKKAAVTPIPTAPTLKDEIPEVSLSTRLTSRSSLLQYGEKRFDENGLIVSPDFLKMFSYKMLKGDIETALSDPYSIIITESLAKKYFGDDDPIGKTVKENNRTDFTVTGIIQDVPSQSHLQFNYLMPFQLLERFNVDLNRWQNISYYSYVILANDSDIQTVTQKITKCVNSHYEGKELNCVLQPITSIYLHSNFMFDMAIQGNIQSVIIFSVVALFVLIIACINFMNLTTARSSQRAKEIGLRKVSGALRIELIKQFFSETFALTHISLLFAIVLVVLLLPPFNTISGKELSLNFSENLTLFLGFIGIALFTGAVSGIYPALFLSSFQPVTVLTGKLHKGNKRALFRKVLVIFQFSITIIVLIGMTVVQKQSHFLREKDLGYNSDHLLTLRMRGAMRTQYDTVKDKLLQHPDILNVAATRYSPTRLQGGTLIKDWEGKNTDEEFHFKMLWVDADFLETFKMKMSDGRFFTKEIPAEQHQYVLNETAVKVMGMDSPVGKRFDDGIIIGVVKDFHFTSLHKSIAPLMLTYRPEMFRTLCIRLNPQNADMPGLIQYLEKLWSQFSPEYPFEYQFVEQRLDSLYKSEKHLRELFNYFSILTIFIACLGLFGLASFIAEQRTKEIGIRKVLGSSISDILQLLTKEFTRWIFIAAIIASPVAWFVMNKWLQGFAYRTNIGILTFVFAGALTFAIAFLTVSYQAIKAATANPVDALKYE